MDLNEVASLLHVAEKTLQWSKLKPIHDAAMRKLEEHANDMNQQAERLKAETKAKAEAEAAAEAPAEEAPAEEEVRRRET